MVTNFSYQDDVWADIQFMAKAVTPWIESITTGRDYSGFKNQRTKIHTNFSSGVLRETSEAQYWNPNTDIETSKVGSLKNSYHTREIQVE